MDNLEKGDKAFMLTPIGKRVGIIFLVLVTTTITIGCSDNRNNSAQKERIENDLLTEKYNSAVRLARNNKSEGLLSLYEISSSSKSAELSEIADIELHYLLYKNTSLWIKTFAALPDLERFKSDFAKMSELDIYEFPEGKIPIDEYKRDVVRRLKKIKGNKREMELTNFVLQMYSK